MSTAVEVGDVQSLVFSGHGKLPGSIAVGLRVKDAERSRPALRALVERDVAFGIGGSSDGGAGQGRPSAGGVAALGGSATDLAGFSRQFQQGMVTSQRSRALGDAGAGAPEQWEWSDGTIDSLLLIYARDRAAAESLAARITRPLADSWTVAFELPIDLPADGREPFGFRDGISVTRVDVGDGRAPPAGVALLPPGEIVMGYTNAARLAPAPPPLGKNGVFVVVRQMEQDVARFWNFWRRQARDEQEAVWLASKALGRWPNGMPVDGSAAKPEPACNEAAVLAPLQFSEDARGLKCPFGAHVRRANPRDGLLEDRAASVEIVAQHRMIRRGRVYGPPAPLAWYPPAIRDAKSGGPEGVASAERGLFFMCLCADIARQFEFVQQTWLNNPKFSDLYDEVDPVAAGHELPADGHRFSIPREPLRCRINGVSRWVRVRSGGYFLLPGKRALLRFLTGPA